MHKTNRLLLVTSEFPPQPGGIGIHAYHLAKHLEQEGFQVKVITDQRSQSGQEEADFDASLKFQVQRVVIRKLRVLMYFKRLQLLFKHVKSSDILIASGKFSLWSVAFVSLFYRKSYFAVIHGSEVNLKKTLLKSAINISLNRFSKLIAVSHYTKDLVSKEHSDIVLIPNGIDIASLENSIPITKTLEGYPRLLTVGNVTQRKGQLNVIKQLPDLLEVYPNLHYHCVGLPTEAEAFMEVAESLHVAHHVTFHGRVPNETLYDFLRLSDIFVMLSHETTEGDVEGFGIAILEANFFGLPAIGSLGCGIEDAIDDFQSGRLIKNYDSLMFEKSIKDILSRPGHYKDGAKIWAQQHDWKLIVKHYIAVINK